METKTLLYIILAGIVALLVALFMYKYKEKSKSKVQILFTFLRFFSVFCILLLLINPKIEHTSIYNEKPNLVIAVDNSSSISHLEKSNQVVNIVNTLKNNEALQSKFNIDFYSFGNELIPNVDSLTFKDSRSNLDNVFKGLSQINKNTTSPTLIITDGNQTYGNDYIFSALKYKQPLYPVILGDTIQYSDLKIQQLNVNKYAFLKNKFPVEGILVYNGLETINTRFKITSGSKVVWSKQIQFSKEDNSKILNFTLPAKNVGVFQYKATLEPIVNEKNTINNIKNFAVDVVDEKTNIAIVSDFLHPDLGALKKSIERNEQRKVSLLNPKKYIKQKDDFQLVIIYQPNNNFRKVFSIIKTLEVNSFIIAGTKTSWRFLNTQGLNFTHEINTQFEDYQAISNSNYASFVIPDLDFNSFPPLKSKFGNLSIAIPFETLLYKNINGIATEHPLLATMETNGKRTALLLGENIWQWRAQSSINKSSFNEFDNFIGKLIQYLASNKPKSRLNIDYESFYEGSTNLIIKAQFFNKNYEFDTRETLNIAVTNKETKEKQTLPFILKRNTYQVDLSSLKPGTYNFIVRTEKSKISRSGKFQILEYAIEKQFLNADVTKLQHIATNSNGNAYFIANTETIIDDLINDSRFVTVQKSSKKSVPLIDFKYLLALIVLSLALEWFLRKYNGLI